MSLVLSKLKKLHYRRLTLDTLEVTSAPKVNVKATPSYTGNLFSTRAYSIRADYCVPFNTDEYYFEVEILDDKGHG